MVKWEGLRMMALGYVLMALYGLQSGDYSMFSPQSDSVFLWLPLMVLGSLVLGAIALGISFLIVSCTLGVEGARRVLDSFGRPD